MIRIVLAVAFLAAVCLRSEAAVGLTSWHSTVLGADIPAELLPPTAPVLAEAPPVVIYLRNLASPRVGIEPDADIIASFRAEGFLVLCLDYQKHEKARVPHINRDLSALREQMHRRKLIPGWNLNTNRCFIIPSGHRLSQNLVFFRDGGRVLGIDLIYPSKPSKPVGTVLEFSCDNANRMGSYSLHVCSDTLLEGFAIEGFAVAMADHPVAPYYKGRDPMPDSARKIKAAVRLLRAETIKRGGNGRIAPVGFSRGSGMALMLAATEGMKEFDGYGEIPEGDSSVQGAVILSGRFTYLDLLPDDPMIPRYERWWGPKAGNEDLWKRQGAMDYLTKPTIPLFLSINISEAPEALHQMKLLRKQLAELGSDEVFLMDRTPLGHKVPLDPGILSGMAAYLHRQLE